LTGETIDQRSSTIIPFLLAYYCLCFNRVGLLASGPNK
jgi:hypothetical protein